MCWRQTSTRVAGRLKPNGEPDPQSHWLDHAPVSVGGQSLRSGYWLEFWSKIGGGVHDHRALNRPAGGVVKYRRAPITQVYGEETWVNPGMSDIFICYSRKNLAIAQNLRQRLLAQGWSVFMDRNIDAGHRWSEEIQHELAQARAVLTLWSQDSVKSRFVMDEAHEAAERNIIFPARVEAVPLPYGFRQFQTKDLIGWDGQGEREEWDQIVRALRKHLDEARPSRESEDEPVPDAPKTSSQPAVGHTDPPPDRHGKPRKKARDTNRTEATPQRNPKQAGAPVNHTAPTPPDDPTAINTGNDEITRLLAELDNPETPPPRRLEIGDRLDALGDPRTGVGLIEIEVTSAASPPEARRSPVRPRLGPAIDRLWAELDDPATPPPRRLAIGDELEGLGDPRPGVGLDRDGVPAIDWVAIPPGRFEYQQGETLELPGFWMARYPVTNRQFQAFIAAGGYGVAPGLLSKTLQALTKLTARETEAGTDEWWNLRKPQPEASYWPQGNRPRTNVDWYEAIAFTRWLGARLGLPEGALRLPTEVEWERAARGAAGRIYPWGNEYRPGYANVNETLQKDGPWYLGQTTAVGVYPHGASPEGVEDLSGGVWEWCLNRFDDPGDTRVDASGAPRALRGGSWNGQPDYADATVHGDPHPEFRDYFIGFRVLSSVPMTAVP